MSAGETAELGVGVDVNCPAGAVPFWAGVATGVAPGSAGVAAGDGPGAAGVATGVGPGCAGVGVAVEMHAVRAAARRNTDRHQRGFT